MAQIIPNRQTKKWRVSYKGAWFGDIIRSFLINLFFAKGLIKAGSKLYPHSVTSIEPPSDYTNATIYDGAAYTAKLWAIASGKEIFRSLGNAAFSLDTATGLNSGETTNDGSDITSVADDSGETIEVVELSTPVGSGAFQITGGGNTVKWAQSFTQVGGPVSKVSFYLAKIGSPTDNIRVAIQADSAGVPSGSNLTYVDIDNASLTTSFVLFEKEIADFSATLQLDTATTYWLVFSRSGSADADNYPLGLLSFGGNQDNEDNDPYANGELIAYNGSTWVPTITLKKTDTFTDDGTWTIPAGVTTAEVELWAAGGGSKTNTGGGGGGAYTFATITGLVAAEIIDIQVGQALGADIDGEDSIFNGVEVLVVAGGGGGGAGGASDEAGGGGAGGVLQKFVALTVASYTLTIGAGGAGSTNNAVRGANGQNSTFDSLLTAIGGGGGGSQSTEDTGALGGSGGGGANSAAGGAATPGQGYAGGTASSTGGGGGGGAGAVGAVGGVNVGGNGGAGISSSINGTPTSYGGGGGGAAPTTAGTGGAGGGGNGSIAGNGSNATANTGGGGGGGASDGGSGGSGKIIVRYRTANFTMSGGTATTDGLFTIRTFNSSDTLVVSAVDHEIATAKGGKSGTNGGTGGLASAGVGDTKYDGGDGTVGTGDAGGGGGAGNLGAGGDAATDLGGQGGESQGGSGGGDLNGTYVNGGSMYGGGGNSAAAAQYSGARGEVRISYTQTLVASYANVIGRSFGRSTIATSHEVETPAGTLPGDLLIAIVSLDNSSTASLSGWTELESQVAGGNGCTQYIFWKRADGNDSGFLTSSITTGITYVCYRIVNGGTPTAIQNTAAGAADPPELDAYTTANYLWIVASTFSNQGTPSNNPTAAPSGYGSFIIEPEFFPYDTIGTLGARTAVADKQSNAGSENPGAFTGAGASQSIGATICVPYDASEYFYDASAAITVEFPAADERLYITTTKDVKFLNAENGIWQSLWIGVFQQDPLESAWPHPMKQVNAGKVLFVGDGNKIHSMIATGNNQIEAIASRIVVPNKYYNNWIVNTKSAMFFGFADKQSESLPSLICYFEPTSELLRIFKIKEGATVGFESDENCHIIDKKGQIRYFNGSSFQAYNWFPPYYDNIKMTTLPHRNGISVSDGKASILWEGQYPYPAGIWVLEDDNLYHNKSFVFSPSALNSLGAMEAGGDWRALYDTGDQVYASVELDNGAGSTVEGIFSDYKLAGTTVSDNTRGHFVTARFTSEHIDSKWQRIFAKWDKRLDGITEGEVVLKWRTKKAAIGEGVNADAFSGTWTSATTFTTTTQAFRDAVDAGTIEVGDEIIVRKGMGGGLLAHITAITGTTTRTVTIAAGLAAITSGTFTFSVENWRVAGNRMTAPTQAAEWIQLKVELQDQVGLEEIQITSSNNQKL